MAEQKKKFTLFRYNIDGKGVPKDVDEPRNFKFFFKLLGRNLNRLLSVNLLLVFSNFPIFFAMFAASGNLDTTSYAPVSSLFGPVYGALKISGSSSPAVSSLMGAVGLQVQILIPTLATNIFYGLAWLTLLTFGFSMVGTTYIVRNMVKGDPVFMMHDFKHAIKKNWRQALIFGIIDLGISWLIIYDLTFFASHSTGDYGTSLMFYVALFIGLIYLVMRYYIYTMMVTFKLSIFKLLKNSFIFALVGVKRNILGTIGIAALLLLNYMILMTIPALGAILPFVLTLAIAQFIAIYTSWPKIHSIMIAPYEEEKEETPEEEPIFKDRG